MVTKTEYIQKILLGFTYFIRLLILIEAVTAAWNKNLLLLFISVGILIITFTPSYIAKNFNINLPIEFEFLLFTFITGALFFGEIYKFYFKFWWWDLFLHSLSSILLAFGAYLVVYIAYTEKKFKTTPRFVAIFSFCFALAIGTLWEIVEFNSDILFGTNMLKSGLVDTMTDLIVDTLSALLVSVAGYFYLKKREPTKLFEKILKMFIEKNPHLFKKRLNKK